MGIRKAVIVAAGLGSRLGALTESIPKCLLKLGQETFIQRSIQTLKKQGIRDIAIVVGYKRQAIMDALGKDYCYIFNPFYRETNNMASLWFAKEFIGSDDFIYSHADILYAEEILQILMKCNGDIVLSVEKKQCDEESMKIKVDCDGNFVESSKGIPIDEAYGEWVGIAKFCNNGWEKYLVEIENVLEQGKFKAYDTEAMNNLVKKHKGIIKIATFKHIPWIEVDFEEDYKKAQKIYEMLVI